ncbi:MAG TPA: hypothetical protein VNH46_12795 [Gemmatimonadales bacterium]|nr:hypothetical protein [Gemmatimonadales bacterium]
MMRRPWMAAALCLGTMAASRAPLQTPRHYRLDIKTTQVVDLAAMGQGEQRIQISTTGFVTLESHDSAGGQAVKIVLDSLQLGDSSPISPEQAKAANGAIWNGFVPSSGRIEHLELTEDNPIANAVTGVLQQLFPPMKAGAKEGQTWTDTTDSEGAPGLAVRTVTNFQTSADSFHGKKALRLAGASSSAISGTQESPQGSVAFEGTGTATVDWYIGPDGVMLGSSYHGTQSLKLTAPVSPQPLPVTITIEGTTALLE